ncbi:hypothetical protein P9858_22455 [Niallia circulans]|nr:hypothetical protein [Niallia nealsonii]MED5102893.1 hypothetical protein [Niallia circulans]
MSKVCKKRDTKIGTWEVTLDEDMEHPMTLIVMAAARSSIEAE